jgi:DNA polymerase (family X)
MKLETEEVAGLLKEYGLRMSLKGGNPYRSKSYITAARNLKAAGAPLDELIAQGELKTIPGIGDAIADIIVKLHNNGTHPKLEEMRKGLPAPLLELLELPKLRPEDILKIEKTGIKSLPELEDALRKGAISPKVLSPAMQRKLLEGIDLHRASAGKIHLHRAEYLLEEAAAALARRHPELKDLTIAGDFRRSCELVGNFRLVALGPDDRQERINDIELLVRRKDSFACALLFATGSDKHLEHLAARATKKGFTLSPAGLSQGKSRIAIRTESDIYEALGLQYIPPELREGRGEIELAARKKIPVLVTLADVKGIIHAHTNQSDGAATLDEMAEACAEKGFSYLGLTDHSQTAHYAGGLSPREVREQQKDIDRLNKRRRSFRVFKGIESDILTDGSLDYTGDILKKFELVVASIHGQFRKNKDEQTARLVKAAANPHTNVLGHITGRQLLRRHGYDVDIEAVLQACAKHGVAIEVNGHPWRLDIDWRWLARALELGCLVSLDPDAHSVSEIDNVKWAVAMARKGGVSKNNVANCLSREDFRDWLGARK